jgi:hypothetical protein
MHLIADVATAPVAAEFIYVMRGARKRPLIGVDLPATNITHLRLRQAHLIFGARRMLLLGKVILAETLVAIGTMPQRFLVTFVTASSRSNGIVAAALLQCRFSFCVSHEMLFLDELMALYQGI